jgi:hypothetical protein
LRTRISWEPLLSVRAAKMSLRIAEIPGDEPARIGGERKLQVWKWGAAYYYQFLREYFFWKKPLVRTWGVLEAKTEQRAHEAVSSGVSQTSRTPVESKAA